VTFLAKRDFSERDFRKVRQRDVGEDLTFFSLALWVHFINTMDFSPSAERAIENELQYSTAYLHIQNGT